MRPQILILIPFAACSIPADTLNYAGRMQPLLGTCDPPSEAAITIRNSEIIFTPAAGTIALRGKLSSDSATAELVLIDPNKHPYRLSFQGVRHGKTIAGTYFTPRCRYAITLHLTQD